MAEPDYTDAHNAAIAAHAWADRIRPIARSVIDRYRPALDALAHTDECADCRSYAAAVAHIAVLRADDDPTVEPGY